MVLHAGSPACAFQVGPEQSCDTAAWPSGHGQVSTSQSLAAQICFSLPGHSCSAASSYLTFVALRSLAQGPGGTVAEPFDVWRATATGLIDTNLCCGVSSHHFHW
jgi:hypothetical protein